MKTERQKSIRITSRGGKNARGARAARKTYLHVGEPHLDAPRAKRWSIYLKITTGRGKNQITGFARYLKKSFSSESEAHSVAQHIADATGLDAEIRYDE